MTSLEAYKKFLLKINKNDTNSNINISKGQFVLIFNEQKRNWLKITIEKDQSSDLINYIEEILVLNKPLIKLKDYPDRSVFTTPHDYFSYVNSYSLATKGTCTGIKLYNWDIKPKNTNMDLLDEDNNPSFEYRETFLNLSQSGIEVYKKDDFVIDEVYLDYYRQPVNIDLVGYIKIDGTPSITVNPDMEDENVEEIIDMCAVEVQRNYQNTEDYQLAQTREQNHI
jgi:hypothetical protein